MGSFVPTVRDFSKSQEGRKCLEVLFKYDVLPNPDLAKLQATDFSKEVLGRAFEYLLQLLVERQNPDFNFEIPFRHRFGDSRARGSREVKRYFESGEPSDALLNCLISLGEERQRQFKISLSRSKRIVQDGLRIELRRIHNLASTLKWIIKDSFYQGWLTQGRSITAQADLIIDTSLNYVIPRQIRLPDDFLTDCHKVQESGQEIPLKLRYQSK
jgi:hypothetical protein